MNWQKRDNEASLTLALHSWYQKMSKRDQQRIMRHVADMVAGGTPLTLAVGHFDIIYGD